MKLDSGTAAFDDDADDVDTSALVDPDDAGPSKPLAIAAIFASMAAVFGVVVGVAKLHGRHVSAGLDALHQPYYWSPTGSVADDGIVLLIAVVPCIGAVFRVRGAGNKLATIGLILWSLALFQWIERQSYFTIVGTRVTLFSARPWRQPVAFDLKDVEIVKRGCGHWGGRHKRDYAKFIVRDAASGTELNIAAGFNAYGAEDWLRIMQPYLDGSIPLDDGVDTERSPHCMSAKGQLLDPARRAQLRLLLRTDDFPRVAF